MEKTITINNMPVLTWNWLKMNKSSLTIDFDNSKFIDNQLVFENIPEGFAISDNTSIFDNALSKIEKKQTFKDLFQPAIGEEASEISAKFSKKVLIQVLSKTKEPLIIKFDSKKNQYFTSEEYIYATKDSECTIIFVFENLAPDFSIINTKILAEENAKINIIKIQLLSEGSIQIDETSFIEQKDANISFTQIELGGSSIFTGLNTALLEYNSSFTSNFAYNCSNNQLLDINHRVVHVGQKTSSSMKVNGSLKDNASKTYRGTIDFRTGSSLSKGTETEETLLLDSKVINKSNPIILCSEEDIEGDHGATIGRLSNEILFYMQNRGISEQEAKKIIAKAKVQAVVSTIPSEQIRNKINSYMDKVF